MKSVAYSRYIFHPPAFRQGSKPLASKACMRVRDMKAQNTALLRFAKSCGDRVETGLS